MYLYRFQIRIDGEGDRIYRNEKQVCSIIFILTDIFGIYADFYG